MVTNCKCNWIGENGVGVLILFSTVSGWTCSIFGYWRIDNPYWPQWRSTCRVYIFR